MKIGFDVSPLCRPHPPGVVRATRGLVDALERRGRVEVVRLAPPPRVSLLAWRQSTLSRAPRELGLDGLHSPVSAFAVRGRGARVATIHEMPWVRGASENADARHRLWAALGPVRADAIVCPSESTAADVRDGSPLARHKVRVCPWGVDTRFVPPSADERRDVDDRAVLVRFDLADAPYVLVAGGGREKKNVRASIAGLECAARDLTLVITGPITPELARELARASRAVRVRLVGTVSDDELVALTRRAIASLVLSTSEGFGFPVIEAQACGTPVIVPQAGAQAEIAGGAALSVDPRDPFEVAAAILRARRERDAVARAGLAHAAVYTWDRCAEAVERAWESLS